MKPQGPREVPAAANHANASPDAERDRRVLQTQTDMLFRRGQTSTLFGVCFAWLVCAGVLSEIDASLAWTWLGLRCVISLARLAMGYLYFNAPGQTHDETWRRWFIIGVGIDGLGWSLLCVWLAPANDPQAITLLLASLMGVSAVGMFVLQPSWRANLAFLGSMLLPVAANQLLAESKFGFFAGSSLLLFLLAMLVEARYAEARSRELLTLRFDTDRIADERAEALLLAQRQSNVKNQFLATMSHEMRTPLHGILGLTRMLQGDKPVQPAEKLALIERAGEHLLTLINDVLDFSKIEAGQTRLSNKDFDLATLIDEVVSLSAPAAAESGLMLISRLHLPRPCMVHGDASRLRQVLHNLVGNAVKFTEVGSVTVIAKQKGSKVRIAVHDTGVGISAEELPRIFDAFHQADSSFTRRFGGTGLGLTIARELARAMGGDLLCASRHGHGSCFTVTVDMPTVSEAQAPVAAPPVAAAQPAELLQGRVLLAEDNPVNALVAEAALKKMGLTVELVEDGLQAVAAFRAKRPDLVLLDCQMPVMDGFEAARRIRALEGDGGLSRTPVVALTANALQGDREQSLAAGMDDHLAKPFRDEELRAVLQRLLAAAQAAA